MRTSIIFRHVNVGLFSPFVCVCALTCCCCWLSLNVDASSAAGHVRRVMQGNSHGWKQQEMKSSLLVSSEGSFVKKKSIDDVLKHL